MCFRGPGTRTEVEKVLAVVFFFTLVLVRIISQGRRATLYTFFLKTSKTIYKVTNDRRRGRGAAGAILPVVTYRNINAFLLVKLVKTSTFFNFMSEPSMSRVIMRNDGYCTYN
jgi:hypothetical protein